MPVYFRLLTDNRTCHSDISLSLPNPQNKNEADWASYYVRKWIFFFLRFSHEEHSADVCRVWHSEAVAPSLSSDQEWKLICRAAFTQLHPACARPPNRPLCFNDSDKPAINLLSFRSLFLFSFSSPVYKPVSLNHWIKHSYTEVPKEIPKLIKDHMMFSYWFVRVTSIRLSLCSAMHQCQKLKVLHAKSAFLIITHYPV